MSLNEQIISLVFSFVYGIFLAFSYNFNYNLLFNKTKIFKAFFNILLVFDLVLIYFLLIKKINGGIIHPYFYILIVIGFIINFNFSKRLRKFFKIKEKTVTKSVKKD